MQDDIPSEYATGSDGALSNRLAARPSALFVYGTLQFDAVLSGLIGRVPEGTSAIANGWRAGPRRTRLPGAGARTRLRCGRLSVDRPESA